MFSGLLAGAMSGGGRALERVGMERRRELADHLRLQMQATLQREYQQAGFAHAEGMADKGIAADDRRWEVDNERRQRELLDKYAREDASAAAAQDRWEQELELQSRPVPPRQHVVNTAEGVFMVGEDGNKERIGSPIPKGDQDRPIPAALSKFLMEKAEQQARSESGKIFNRKSKEETNRRIMKIYQGFLSDLGYGPSSAPPGTATGTGPIAEEQGEQGQNNLKAELARILQEDGGDLLANPEPDIGPTVKNAGLLEQGMAAEKERRVAELEKERAKLIEEMDPERQERRGRVLKQQIADRSVQRSREKQALDLAERERLSGATSPRAPTDRRKQRLEEIEAELSRLQG